MTTTVAVVTVSDGVHRGTREDGSGAQAEKLLVAAGLAPTTRLVVPDEHDEIVAALRSLVAGGCSLVVTTGGTGLGPRDVTPEATREVIEREAPGLSELMRSAGVEKTPFAALSRGVAGVGGATLIINLPGSATAVAESLGAIVELLPHALETLEGRTAHG